MPETTAHPLDISSDDDPYHYDYVCEQLTAMLNTVNPDDNTYTSRGQNVGWRNISGTTTVTLTSGADLVSKLCPDGHWSLTATLLSDDELELRLGHHDSPTGETHLITAE